MVQSPSWEANWFAASQEIPRISRNPKVHYRITNILVEARANIKQQTWTVGPFQGVKRSSVNFWTDFLLLL